MIKENIYLAGGGNTEGSYTLDNAFINDLADRSITNLVYIPVAQRQENFRSAEQWFRGAFENRGVIIDVWTELLSKNLRGTDTSIGVYIGGGNTLRLLNNMRETRFDIQLIDFVQAGGVLYGGSAGAIILGKDIRTAPEARCADAQSSKGLNLLHGYSVACHDDGSDESKNEHLKTSEKIDSPIIAVTEKGGVIVRGERVQIIGSDQVRILYQGQEERLNSPALLLSSFFRHGPEIT